MSLAIQKRGIFAVKFILTASRFLNILALCSVVLLIVKILILNDIKELFGGAYELGVIVEAILASILASYIFYMVVVHIKEYNDRKYIYPLILKWANRILGDCINQLNEISKASGVSLDLNNVTENAINSAFSKINPNSQAPLLLVFPNTHANWIQFMLYHRKRTKNNSEKLISQMLFVESELVSKVVEVDDCSHFCQLENVAAAPINNTNISFMASLFYKYCILCNGLKKLIEVSQSKYG